MSRKHLIVNNTGRFLSPMGFIPSHTGAYQFDTARDADQHLLDNPLIVEKHGAHVQAVEVSEAVGRFAGGEPAVDFSPWSARR